MRKPSGYIIYRGPSLIDGKPIVAVAITKQSKNSKTGNMVQTYILRDNGISPVENYRSFEDESICGDCKHRRGKGGGCYVNVGQGPNQVFRAILRGSYPFDITEAARASKGRNVRLGTYGDPAAVPSYVWKYLLINSSGHTGYTHQWKRLNDVQDWCMASVDSEEEREQAKAMGWRTFRVRTKDQPINDGEFICPASKEAGSKVQCVDCKACDGGFNARKGSPVIIAHGNVKKRFELMVA